MLNPSPDDIVIVGARRTPQGKLLGQLSSVAATSLGATAIRAAREDSGIDSEHIDHVIMGQVIQADAGQNPARQSAVEAGLLLSTPAVTINSVCLSGLRAITDAARMLHLNEANVIIAGGQESMSNSPYLIRGARCGSAYGGIQTVDSLERDALSDAFNFESMGLNTEKGNAKFGITRAQQDEVAALSHQRAAAARDEGFFAQEIASVAVSRRNGDLDSIGVDQGIRGDSTISSLEGLLPSFAQDGAITAGNSSPISDGAAAVVLTTRAWAADHGIEPLAALGVFSSVAGPDTSLHLQPASAISAALQRAGWSVSDLDFIEINEAFAAVVVASLNELDFPLEKTNIHGGAIALGHPVGASGARVIVHTAHELARRGSGRAAVALCGGGGQGDAVLLWR